MTYLTQQVATNPKGEDAKIPVGGVVFSYDTTSGRNAPLESGESMNTGWIETAGYEALLYVIRGDKPSDMEGIGIEYSDDGLSSFPAGNNFPYTQVDMQIQRVLTPKRKYTRITYKNGAEKQNNFWMEVRLSSGLIQPTESSVNVPMSDTNLALVTKTSIEAKSEGENFKQITRTGTALDVNVVNQASGLIKIDPADLAALENITVTVDPASLAALENITVMGTVGVNNLPAVQAVSIQNSSIGITDAGGSITVDGTVNIGNATLSINDGNGSITIDGTVAVSNFPATQAVSVAALPLPSGAATSALQTAGNNALLSIASNTGNSSASTAASVNLSTTVATILAANANRKGAIITAESNCLIFLGADASATKYTVKLAKDDYYEIPFKYTGIITGITTSSTAVVRVTEIT